MPLMRAPKVKTSALGAAGGSCWGSQSWLPAGRLAIGRRLTTCPSIEYATYHPRMAQESRLKGGCRQDCPPHKGQQKRCRSCAFTFSCSGGHFNAADVPGIAEAATVAVGGHDLHAAAADFVHDAQGALARGFEPLFGQREAIHQRSVTPAGVLDAAFYRSEERRVRKECRSRWS